LSIASIGGCTALSYFTLPFVAGLIINSSVPLALIALVQTMFIWWTGQQSSMQIRNDLTSINNECINSPEFLAKRKTPLSVDGGVKVSGVLCPSGDLALLIVPPDSDGAYRFIDVDDLLQRQAYQPLVSALMPAAIAATRANSSELKLARDFTPTVVCTKTEGNRLVRRIQYANHCETEVIDLDNGNVISVDTNSGACNADC
jgi:hypothetical protein